MKEKLKNWMIMALIIIVIVFSVINYFLRTEKLELAETLSVERTEFKTDIDKLGNVISVQEQRILSQEEAIAAGLLREEDLRKNNIKHIQAYIKVKEHASNLEDIVADWSDNIDTIYIKKDNDYKWLRLPAPFEYSDEWLRLSGKVQVAGVHFYPGGINIKSEPVFTVGYRNKHDSRFRNFFSRPEPVVIYENKVPYFTTGAMENVVIEEKTPFHLRKEVWGSVGFVLGFLLGSR